MPLDWGRVGDSCRNPFFLAEVSVSSLSVAVAILHFVYDLTVSQACLRHQSTWNLMGQTVMPLDGRRIENSCRDPFFCDKVSALFLFCRRHFLHFVCDLTDSQAWLRHQSTRNWMGQTVIPLDGRRIENSSRNQFFCDMVSVLFLFCRRHFLHFVCDLTISRAWLRHHSTWNLMGQTVMLSDWRSSRNSSRNLFFCDDGKCSVAVSFSIRL